LKKYAAFVAETVPLSAETASEEDNE